MTEVHWDSGSSIPQALALASFSTLGSVCFLVPSFLFARTFTLFVGPFSISAVLLYFIQAPVNAVFLWTVPVDQRALAASTSIVAQHLFGDVPSPAAYGALLDSIRKIVSSDAEAYRRQ